MNHKRYSRHPRKCQGTGDKDQIHIFLLYHTHPFWYSVSFPIKAEQNNTCPTLYVFWVIIRLGSVKLYTHVCAHTHTHTELAQQGLHGEYLPLSSVLGLSL